MQRRNLFREKLFSKTHEMPIPWLKSEASFYQECTRCAQCVRACPEHILVPADGGFPGIDFKLGTCTFCGECTTVCPQNLLDKDQISGKLVAEVNQNCLSQQQVSCRSCQDSCAYGAIKFQLHIGKTAPPSINKNLCQGCGACVSPCPTNAINMLSNTQHESVSLR